MDGWMDGCTVLYYTVLYCRLLGEGVMRKSKRVVDGRKLSGVPQFKPCPPPCLAGADADEAFVLSFLPSFISS